MKARLCAVVAHRSHDELERLRIATHSTTEFEFVFSAWRVPLPRDVHVALLLATEDGLQAVVDKVKDLRRSHSNCAVLVAAKGLGADEITSIFQSGAHDFLALPCTPGELGARLRRAASLSAREPNDVRVLLAARLPDFVGNSIAFQRQICGLPLIAGSDAGVLILGETGTGKEVCARAIHYLSSRASRPWVAVNCGAIPLDLVESELFGHVRGAYTNAATSREGLVAEAEGGTLFLDDVDCIPLPAQSKLLRFLQEHEYRSVGDNTIRRADVRVIAASNRDLAELTRRGEFRQDLYFRLHVLTLTLPPLRERGEDVIALAMHFLKQYALEAGVPAPGLTALAADKLLAHDWPGNVRELQHALRRAFISARDRPVSAEDLDVGPHLTEPSATESFRTAKARIVEQFERRYIEHLLITYRGNITHAAHEAKKNRRAFFALMRKHEIESARFRPAK